MQPIIK